MRQMKQNSKSYYFSRLIEKFLTTLSHPASRAFSYGTYALYREKALHESCQVLVEHAPRVAKKQFRTQAESVFIYHSLLLPDLLPPFLLASGGLSFDHRFLPKIDARG